MERLDWIRELVEAERKMEEAGEIDLSAGFDSNKLLAEESIAFLKDLKTAFIESAGAFNQLKNSTIGRVKIYGISKTAADFMLFRNGYKLIFSLKSPGCVSCRFNHIGKQAITGGAETAPVKEDLLLATWGAFGELQWSYQDKPLQLDYLVRYYMTHFLRESLK